MRFCDNALLAVLPRPAGRAPFAKAESGRARYGDFGDLQLYVTLQGSWGLGR